MPSTLTHGSIKRFFHGHDNLPAFHAGYLVATFLAAALFNLGFFLLLILIHMFFDYVKYREVGHQDFLHTMKSVLSESIFDLALLVFALALIVYARHSYPLPLLSGLVRSGLNLAVAVGILIPKMRVFDDIEAAIVHVQTHLYAPPSHPSGELTALQRLSAIVFLVCFFLILFSPILPGVDSGAILWTLRQQLIPWHL